MYFSINVQEKTPSLKHFKEYRNHNEEVLNNVLWSTTCSTPRLYHAWEPHHTDGRWNLRVSGMKIRIMIFWVKTLCNLTGEYKCFRQT
jgi:hypothetical protein